MRLEIAHALEGEDGFDGNPTFSVTGGKGEEVFVDGEVGI